MLALTRRESELLLIELGGELVVIRLTETRPDRARLGIAANRRVNVWRYEIAPPEMQQAADAMIGE